jgi:hypothetical protein
MITAGVVNAACGPVAHEAPKAMAANIATKRIDRIMPRPRC